MKFTTEQELEHRRALIRLAARGNPQACKELAQEYHAFVYSAAQVAKYKPKGEQTIFPAKVQQKFDSLFYVENDVAE